MSILERSAALRALQNRNFAIYTSGNSLSLIGMWVQRVALGVLMWKLTESPFWVGMVAFAEAAPIILLTPLGGVIADLYDQRKVLIICLSISCLQSFMLCILTVLDLITPEWIVGLTLLTGITFAINQTARLTMVPKMIPRDILNPAIALTAVIFNMARFIGPFVGGWVVAEFGFAAAFGLNGVSFISVLVALMLLHLPPFVPRERTENHPFIGFVNDFTEGWKYTFTHPSIGVLILMIAIGAFLVRPFPEFFAGIADVIYGFDPQDEAALAWSVAMLTGAMGIGSILSGAWLANITDLNLLRSLIFPAILVNAISLILLMIMPSFWLAVLVVGISGMAQTISGSGSQSLVQHDVEDEMRGRVLSLWSIAMRGGPALGALVMGLIAGYLGFTIPLIAGGILSFAIVSAIYYRQRANRDTTLSQET